MILNWGYAPEPGVALHWSPALEPCIGALLHPTKNIFEKKFLNLQKHLKMAASICRHQIVDKL